MSNFQDRERGFEAKFAHDSELQFRAMSRRNRALGAWAADVLGKSGPEAEAYIAEVMRSDLAEAGDEDVARKVAGDLAGKVSGPEVRAKMEALLLEVKERLANEV